jgi:hypothetical protein
MSTLSAEIIAMQNELQQKPDKETAFRIIEDYFNFFSKETIQNHLWIFTIAAVTNDELEQSEKGVDRYNHIFFYEFTRLFFDAVHTWYSDDGK